MVSIVLLALLLALIQIWFLPLICSLKNMPYFLSNRDDGSKDNHTVLAGRFHRAASNLQESLPAFLALCILSHVLSVENSQYAFYWLGLRVAFVVCYALGVLYLRSGIWLASLGCLVMMALNLT